MQGGLVAAGDFREMQIGIGVAQHVNLALKLTDGTKMYIPSLGEISKSSAPVAADQALSARDVLGVSTSQQININSANSADLDSLLGAGPATVQKIIAGSRTLLRKT